MRKIERDMVRAIRNDVKWQRDNTQVLVSIRGVDVYLHGHKIATVNLYDQVIKVSSCGYRTATTKSRLNAILREFTDYSIQQRKHEWYLVSKYSDTTFEDDTLVVISK